MRRAASEQRERGEGARAAISEGPGKRTAGVESGERGGERRKRGEGATAASPARARALAGASRARPARSRERRDRLQIRPPIGRLALFWCVGVPSGRPFGAIGRDAFGARPRPRCPAPSAAMRASARAPTCGLGRQMQWKNGREARRRRPFPLRRGFPPRAPGARRDGASHQTPGLGATGAPASPRSALPTRRARPPPSPRPKTLHDGGRVFRPQRAHRAGRWLALSHQGARDGELEGEVWGTLAASETGAGWERGCPSPRLSPEPRRGRGRGVASLRRARPRRVRGAALSTLRARLSPFLCARRSPPPLFPCVRRSSSSLSPSLCARRSPPPPPFLRRLCRCRGFRGLGLKPTTRFSTAFGETR